MTVSDPRGEFEAGYQLVSSHSDRYDDDEDYTFVLRDLRSGDVVRTEYYRCSLALNTGVHSGGAPQAIVFTEDGKWVEVHLSDHSVDRYPLPGRIEPQTSLRGDGRLKLEWETTRSTLEQGRTHEVYELRYLNPDSGEVLAEKPLVADWGKPASEHDVDLPRIERIVFSPLHDVVCIARADGTNKMEVPGLRNELSLRDGDVRSTSGTRAARLQNEPLDPDARPPHPMSFVTVWGTGSGKPVATVYDKNVGRPTPPPLMREIRLVADGELFIRYQDGTHRTARLRQAKLEIDPQHPLPPDATVTAVVEGDFVRLARTKDRSVIRSVFIPDGRVVQALEVTERPWAHDLRIAYEDGGVELLHFEMFHDWMEIVRPPG